MTYLTGVDIIELARISRAIERWGDRFLRRVYSEDEIARYSSKIDSLAARFAAKEAVLKLLDGSRKGIKWTDIEVLAQPGGKPVVNLRGNAARAARQLGINEIEISLSHCRDYAIASVIGTAGT